MLRGAAARDERAKTSSLVDVNNGEGRKRPKREGGGEMRMAETELGSLIRTRRIAFE
jgi:hypothetical protein